MTLPECFLNIFNIKSQNINYSLRCKYLVQQYSYMIFLIGTHYKKVKCLLFLADRKFICKEKLFKYIPEIQRIHSSITLRNLSKMAM